MPTIHNLTDYLESIAPSAYQEDYDNSGLLVGNPETEIDGVLISLDCTEAIIEEAIKKNCNVVVAHHPIVFKGLKRFNGSDYVQRTIISGIRNNVAIYAIHTNLDHVMTGVNQMIANRLELQDTRILAPKRQALMKLTYFIPPHEADRSLEALYQAGAGQIGAYSECSFQLLGEGTFKPGVDSNPHTGNRGTLERSTEKRIEVMFPAHLEKKVMRALRATHPYEGVAYYLHRLENENQEVGAGMVGELSVPMTRDEFLAHLKEKMEATVIKYTASAGDRISRVAVCGGAGSFLLSKALANQADAFVTADFKYHEFFDAENRIMICDIGHYESEVFTKQLLYEHISKKFDNFALYLSETNTNPVDYYC